MTPATESKTTTTVSAPESSPSGRARRHCLVVAQNEIDYSISNLKAIAPAANIAERAREEFPDLISSIEAQVLYYAQVRITCIVDRMQEIVPLIRYLAKLGYRRNGDPKDDPKQSQRTYRLKNKIDTHWGIQLVVCLKQSAVCHWVTVGEKTVPVQELRCDDWISELEEVEI